VTIPIVVDGHNANAEVVYGTAGEQVTIGGAVPADDAETIVVADGEAFVIRGGRQTRVRLQDFSVGSVTAASSDGAVKAPMHGKVLDLFVGVGDRVAAGQRLAIIEAMKMEHTLHSPFAGTVQRIVVGPGAQVVEGGEIMLIDPAPTG
jgi:3-methylcrotonyl-CoA carboxylase alpha subunit